MIINASPVGIPKRCPYNLASNWECTDSWEAPQNIIIEKIRKGKMKTSITARLDEPITAGQNLIYCATVNLTWNVLSEFLNGQVKLGMRDFRPNATVDFLNRKTFTKEHLDKGCYLAYASLIRDGILDRIKTDLQQKFGESSRINLDPANYGPLDILAYSFLLKVLTFEKKFENLNEHLAFSGQLVDAFGLKKVRVDIEKKLKNQVYVLYYKNDNDFSIALQTQNQDVIILVKTPLLDSDTPASLLARSEASMGPSIGAWSRLQEGESLMIPKIEFDLEHHFKEMIGQSVIVNEKITDYYVGDAVQFIKFLLNEEGAKLRSEMAIHTRRCVMREEKKRQFIFDKPFLLYLKEKDSLPYFVTWVANAEILKPRIRGF